MVMWFSITFKYKKHYTYKVHLFVAPLSSMNEKKEGITLKSITWSNLHLVEPDHVTTYSLNEQEL